MQNYKDALKAVGASVPHILLPAKGTDLSQFAVIACDQFSAQPEYWEQAKNIVGDSHSALKLILPEAYKDEDPLPLIADINNTMEKYLSLGVLSDIGEAMVYLHRSTKTGVRRGLMIALDLDQYDFSPDSKSLIRATEGTVRDRLPLRIQIRQDAQLELPHVMVLVDDPEDILMKGLEAQLSTLPELYDFDLMLEGGHLTGWWVGSEGALSNVAESLTKLLQNSDGMLYAMGDGNHSFAAAKVYWDSIKDSLTPREREQHPARYSLAELVNVYDPALYMEPIHRLVMGVDPAKLQKELDFDAANPPSLQILQPALDKWLEKNPQASLEYIHGENECRSLGKAPNTLPIIFPEFDKSSLFKIVREGGVFVRKSFSIGHATDKRYYLECRKIK